MEEYKHKELTQKIIGCAIRVHGEVGAGFPEVIYQRSLAIEMRYAGLSFEEEIHLPLYYRQESVGSRRADFLVEGTVLLELKATTRVFIVCKSIFCVELLCLASIITPALTGSIKRQLA